MTRSDFISGQWTLPLLSGSLFTIIGLSLKGSSETRNWTILVSLSKSGATRD